MTEGEQHTPGSAGGSQFRRFWSAYVDALERHLDHMKQLIPAKKKDPNRDSKKGEPK
jgi:hypothetical protein